MPTTSAVRITDHTGTLHVSEVELPVPGPREVLVDLLYAGVNPVDQYTSKGLVSPNGPLPRTLGGEGSGRLDDRPVMVTGAGLGASRDGAWSRRAVVPREAVLALPAGVDPRQAAAAGVEGLTAWSTVVELAQVTGSSSSAPPAASG